MSTGDWKVLLVDDEPAMHEVTQMILAGLRFEGREVTLLTANSAAQARELLDQERGIAVVLLDVVMESDDAGMRLVQHIREQLRDLDMQIVLRTGQPGMAPEGEIVQRYEINGYVLKTEITAQRLQTLVITALRGFRHAQALRQQPDDMPESLTCSAVQAQTSLCSEMEADTSGTALLLQMQAEVELASKRVCGVELVPNWRSSLGLLSAARMAELLPQGTVRRRVIQQLLQQGCFWAQAWKGSETGPLHVSLPLVGDSLADPQVSALVLAALQQSALPPHLLDLLISEATLGSSVETVRNAIGTLRAAGVSFTLSDFGGQTIALKRLHQMVDRLKLHRVFVRAVRSDSERMAMARSLIALAQTLGLVAIADGIASDDDAQFFRWEGCDLGQGDALVPACAPADLALQLKYGCNASH